MNLEMTYAIRLSWTLGPTGWGMAAFRVCSAPGDAILEIIWLRTEQVQRHTLHLCTDTIAWAARPTRYKLIHNLSPKVKTPPVNASKLIGKIQAHMDILKLY